MSAGQFKPARSLQKTLGVGLTLGVTLLSVIALLGAVLVSQNKLNALFDSALEETAQRIMPLAVVEIINREEPQQAQPVMSFAAHDEALVYLIRDNTGEILLHSHNADPKTFNQTLLSGFSTSATHRFYGAWAVQNTLHIEIAEPLSQRQEAITALAITLLWPLILLVPLCFIATWFFVHYSLRPILVYRDEIEARGSGDLSPVKEQDLPAEFLTVAEAVNHLLERLRRALEAERAFTANSAHELRTPIATALAQTQRLQQGIISDENKARASKVETSLRRLSNLSEKLMQLAKAEGGGLLCAEPHDLNKLIKLIVDDLQRSVSTSRFEMRLPENAVLANIDPDAFAILVRNLLDNALKYGQQQPITITFSSNGVLRISNAADVIPVETLAQLRRRFVRSSGTVMVEGSGLGLAIADAIVTGIGASMSFHSPAKGQIAGFEVEVAFPINLVSTDF